MSKKLTRSKITNLKFLCRPYIDAIKHNGNFLKNIDKEIHLLNDAYKLLDKATKFSTYVKSSEDYAKEPEGLYFTLFHMPYSAGIICDILMGDVPGCYCKIRIMLEGLAYCYDIKGNKTIKAKFNYKKFIEYVELKRNKQTYESTTKIMERIDKKLELVRQTSFTYIWKKTSDYYMHPAGSIKRFVAGIHKEIIPPGSIILPAKYSQSDLNNLKQLDFYIRAIGKLLDKVMS